MEIKKIKIGKLMIKTHVILNCQLQVQKAAVQEDYPLSVYLIYYFIL